MSSFIKSYFQSSNAQPTHSLKRRALEKVHDFDFPSEDDVPPFKRRQIRNNNEDNQYIVDESSDKFEEWVFEASQDQLFNDEHNRTSHTEYKADIKAPDDQADDNEWFFDHIPDDELDEECIDADDVEVAQLSLKDPSKEADYDECLRRFTFRLGQGLSVLHDGIDEYEKVVSKNEANFREDPFHFRFWIHARQRGGVDATRSKFLPAVSKAVQYVFGKETIDQGLIKQYAPLALRRDLSDTRGCYANLATHNDGSRANYASSGGKLWVRLLQHLCEFRNARKKDSKSLQKMAKHYQIVSRPGWKYDFRLLMKFPPATHQIWSFLGETICMFFLSSLEEIEHHFNPASAIDIYKRARVAMGLTDSGAIPLNRALPMHQGIGKDTRPRVCHHCGITPSDPYYVAYRQAGYQCMRWYSVKSLDAFDAYWCEPCASCVKQMGYLPSVETIAKRTINDLRVPSARPTPADNPRTHCQICKVADVAHLHWQNELQKVVCAACLKQNSAKIETLVNAARAKVGLSARKHPLCGYELCYKTGTDKEVLPNNRRFMPNNEVWHIPCYARYKRAQESQAKKMLKGNPNPSKPSKPNTTAFITIPRHMKDQPAIEAEPTSGSESKPPPTTKKPLATTLDRFLRPVDPNIVPAFPTVDASPPFMPKIKQPDQPGQASIAQLFQPIPPIPLPAIPTPAAPSRVMPISMQPTAPPACTVITATPRSKMNQPVTKAKPTPRPKSKPVPTECDQCHKPAEEVTKFTWCGPRMQDLCGTCQGRHNRHKLDVEIPRATTSIHRPKSRPDAANCDHCGVAKADAKSLRWCGPRRQDLCGSCQGKHFSNLLPPV